MKNLVAVFILGHVQNSIVWRPDTQPQRLILCLLIDWRVDFVVLFKNAENVLFKKKRWFPKIVKFDIHLEKPASLLESRKLFSTKYLTNFPIRKIKLPQTFRTLQYMYNLKEVPPVWLS